VEASRVVEVYCAAGKTVGTGYLTTGSTVLTAWHVVEAAGPSGVVEIRALTRDGQASEWFRAIVVWPTLNRLPSPVDVAMLALADENWRVPGLVPVRWGRIVGDRPVAVTGLGFPDAANHPTLGDLTPTRSRRDPLPLTGNLYPLAHAKSGDRYVKVGLTGSIPTQGNEQSSPWSGVSGAALFSGDTDILLAVATTDHRLTVDARTLIAIPVMALAATPGFEDAAESHGIWIELVPVPRARAHAKAPRSPAPTTPGADPTASAPNGS
jgi:hypothetical protein